MAAFLLVTAFCALPSAAQTLTEPANTAKVEEAGAAVEAEKTPEIKNKLIATPEPNLTITVEGKALPNAQVVRNEEGHVFVRAEPILDFLDDDYAFNGETGALVVTRSQDGVRMELYTDTGIIKANGKTIGKLRIFGEVTENSITLTPNAIAVLSGARPNHDEDTGVLHFELDPRLKVASGFLLYVNGSHLINPEPAPKSVGPVLLLPLLPITDELGGFVTVSPDLNTITVRRAQDSAEFELNLSTGLIRDAGRPIGISKDATYIDATNLLLPVSAIEVLTGTHISVDPGSDRVDIELDDRLSGAVAPDAKVSDLASNEPFTLETLDFTLGPDVRNQVSVNFRAKGINGKLRYEIPDLPTSEGELRPNWGSLQYRTLDGMSGSFGDYSADFRELDGVGIRRIRGASASKTGEHGRWALAVGTPVNGSERISEDQTRFTFGGLAAGMRWADAGGWEAGLSMNYNDQAEDQRAVLSLVSGKIGHKEGKKLSWDARGDLGYFSGPSRLKSLDVRVSSAARYALNNNFDVDVSASYDGAEFLKSVLSREALEKALVVSETGKTMEDDTRTIPDIRRIGQDQASLTAALQYSARRDIGVFKNPGAALRFQRSTSGVTVGAENAVTLTNWGMTSSTTLARTNTFLTGSYSLYMRQSALLPESDEEGYSLSLQGYQNTRFGTVRAQYSESQMGNDGKLQRADIALSVKSKQFNLPKAATVTVAPTLNAVWTPQSGYFRGGIVASAHSGDLLGRKNRLTASVGVLQNFGGLGDGEPDTYFTLSGARRLHLNDNLSLGMTYRNNLKGEQRFGLRLDGHYGFNAARKFRATEDGRGVLKGRAFLDKNRDGIRQDGEPGLNGVTLRVADGARKLGLRTDGDGYYTIQNIKTGIKTITIDGRSLPLGYALSDDSLLRATIRDGHITTVDLPIVQRGQVRGFAFIDQNANNVYDNGETRLEGARLKLSAKNDAAETHETMTTSFGQYAFDDLPAGDYVLSILKTNNSDALPGRSVVLSLDPSERLMTKAAIGARAADVKREFVEEDRPATTIAYHDFENTNIAQGEVIATP